jgi:hypothetical protein
MASVEGITVEMPRKIPTAIALFERQHVKGKALRAAGRNAVRRRHAADV